FLPAAVANRPYDVSTLLSALTCPELINNLRQHLKQIPHHTKIRHLKNRGVFILVDGNNGFGGLHTGQVLDGPRNTHRNIQVRRYGDTGLTHLQVMRHIAGIHGSTRGTNGRVELISQILDQREILCRTQSTTTRNNNAGGSQRRTVTTGLDFFRRHDCSTRTSGHLSLRVYHHRLNHSLPTSLNSTRTNGNNHQPTLNSGFSIVISTKHRMLGNRFLPISIPIKPSSINGHRTLCTNSNTTSNSSIHRSMSHHQQRSTIMSHRGNTCCHHSRTQLILRPSMDKNLRSTSSPQRGKHLRIG